MALFHKDYLDEIIKDTLKERVKRHGGAPDPQNMWKKIEREILLREGAKQKSYKRIAGFSFAALFILSMGIGLFAFPGSVRGVGQKILKQFNGILVGDSIIMQEEIAYDAVQSPDSQSLSIDELLKTATFPVSLPGYLPEGYALESVAWNTLGGNSGEAVLEYVNNEITLLVRQRNIIDDYASGVGVDVDDTQISKIKLRNGITASMAYRKKDGWCKVWWINSDISYQVSGSIKTDEIIKISNSL